MPCNRGYITNWNWTEAQRPIIDLRTVYLALKKLGIMWNEAPQSLNNWHEARNSLTSSQKVAQRIISLSRLANLVNEIQTLNIPQITLSNGMILSWRNGSYSIGKQERIRSGQQTQTGAEISQFVTNFDAAYASIEIEMQNELDNILEDIESGKSQLAAEEIEAHRARIDSEKNALNKSRQQLRETRMKHVETVGETLGYAIRKQRIGKKIKYVLVRNP